MHQVNEPLSVIPYPRLHGVLVMPNKLAAIFRLSVKCYRIKSWEVERHSYQCPCYFRGDRLRWEFRDGDTQFQMFSLSAGYGFPNNHSSDLDSGHFWFLLQFNYPQVTHTSILKLDIFKSSTKYGVDSINTSDVKCIFMDKNSIRAPPKLPLVYFRLFLVIS